MKQTTKKWFMPAIFLSVTISLFVSCKKENEASVRKPVADEVNTMLSKPIAAESPKTGAATQETEALVLPRGLKTPGGSGSGISDFVDFDDPLALDLLPDDAKYTYASAPFYIQQVGNAWIHVKENSSGSYLPSFISNYGHYHLGFQDFEACLQEDGEFGKPIGGGCANINPLMERRELETHQENQWIKIYAYDAGNPQRVFDLERIKVTHNSLQLWFKKNNGGWFKWNNLTVGIWDLSAYSFGITEVLIAGNGNGIVGFDDVKVKVPNN